MFLIYFYSIVCKILQEFHKKLVCTARPTTSSIMSSKWRGPTQNSDCPHHQDVGSCGQKKRKTAFAAFPLWERKRGILLAILVKQREREFPKRQSWMPNFLGDRG